MTSRRTAFWQWWLTLVTIGVMVFGLSMVVTPGLIQQFFGLLIYSAADFMARTFDAAAVRYITLTHGVLGAVMFGWGAALLLVLRGPFRRGQREGWLMLTVSLAAWWLPDTWFSLQTGFWQNALLNVVFGVLFAVPLFATRSMLKAKP